jgi:hypothetical protein
LFGDTLEASVKSRHENRYSEAQSSAKMVLGRYLGPSNDIGPAMTAKRLKANWHIYI